MLTETDLTLEQLRAIQFILEGEDSLISADVGVGKSVIAGSAAAHTLYTGEIKRWLILAPLLVATDTWVEEFQRWEHLSGLRVAVACGNKTQRIDALHSDAQIVIMNYENIRWLLEEVFPKPRVGRPETLPFDGLICDEVDKLKDVSSQRFKAFRNRIHVFNKRIGLTGTLIPNDLQELWGQVYIVDGGQSFGRSFYKWRQRYFYPTDFNQWNWEPHPHAKDQLIDAILDLTFRIKAKGLPEIVMMKPEMVVLPVEIHQDYLRLEREFYLTLEDNLKKEINVANAAVLVGKLQQITAGFSYLEGHERTASEAHWHTDIKYTDWLARLLRIGKIEQLLVIYNFRAELDMLQEMFDMPYIGGGVSNKEARRLIGEWNAGRLAYLALHPASAGHGLNLQHSGAHHIAFTTLPWSGGLFRQVVGRLARRGNPAPKIFVHTCLFHETIDEAIHRTIMGKLNTMVDFLNALEARA